MYFANLKTWTTRRSTTLLCGCLMLAGCGLAGGHGSLANGTEYQAKGEYRAAYIEAKKALQKDDKSGEAWLLLGKASLMMGDPKSALTDLEKAKANGVTAEHYAIPMGQALLATGQGDKLLKTFSGNDTLTSKVKARVGALRGDAYVALGKTDEAAKAYKAALSDDPNDVRAMVGLAKLAVLAKDTVTAGNYVQRALAAAPDSPQALTASGDLAFNRGDFAGAEAAYQKAVDLKHPDWLPQEHFYTLARLADAQTEQNKLDKALANIKTMEKMSPQQPMPHYLHAVVLYKQGHLDEAVTQLQQVLKAAPDNTKAQLLMGAVNYAQGNYGQAEMYLSNVMGVNPRDVNARKLLALTLYREGRSQQALDTLRPAVSGKHTDAELLAQLQKAAAEGVGMPGSPAMAGEAKPANTAFTPVGKALASGDEAEAIKLLNAMPKGDASTEAQRNTLLVLSYLREKRTDEAVKAAASYASANPNDSSAHLLYGTALVAAGQRDKAREQYSKASTLDPKNVAALLSLGSLDALEGKNKDAAAHYEDALKVDPNNAAAMTELGRLAMRQGNKADAIKWFKQAIAASPKSPTAYLGLVVAYGENHQLDQAVGVAKQLVQVDPNNPAALNALGAAQLSAGKYADALKPLQQAVNLAPNEALFRTNLARAQILNKDTKDAAANLDQVIKSGPGQVSAVKMAAFLKLQQHDLPGAIALAKTLQGASATQADGYALEGDLYMANKSYDDAANAYQQGLKAKYDRELVIKRFLALRAAGASKPEAMLTEWLAKNPDDAATRLLLGQYYLDLSQNKLAADQYERILKAYPSNVAVLNNLAWIYTEQRNPKGLELAGKAYKLAPKAASIADTYGWALIANDQAKTALPILETAAKAAPKSGAIQYHLAVAQNDTGDKAGARATLEALQKSGADFKEKPAAEKLYAELGGTTGGSGK